MKKGQEKQQEVIELEQEFQKLNDAMANLDMISEPTHYVSIKHRCEPQYTT
jgi:hypothetical protein